ncbi:MULTISPECIES: sugar ABC transporter ATP-binding protein [unclassified Mycolicibacterium]|uniref:sugar ABC transporter ATP-binding protein n=1 Tax=unclassified Mycolicibacterium TaxID=2636767 RepID=UPI0012DCD1C6|nr:MULTISPECIES: sugar ABC transporter ATP-binding protein [unclassified Mycolicibacterium]MUL84483.1 sugar ABC transporter ATP-binding protein [Mycolicibacterium sp. CBMA 329]MUL88258.1 sugar ABC transporter ATP-binding protein [Mycolicibacterium sp. CBMA 331]MUL99293.1 sugar ABC transporter ATP-binding protein [Mycolicibacterium sp. CBMA 334]MUM28116.1 sugar ABC transporter ATP-binding protein [Mycolicibacterium sp. CBMA 295]MUM39905.1 sugar ABC transporter ATP-binding protein [Mycolicibacte
MTTDHNGGSTSPTLTVDAGRVTALRMQDIVKSFPGTKACDGATLEVARGEVHCLLGENGAGKSTMMKILSGSYVPDSGTITLEGEQVSFGSPIDGVRAGINTIYQELDLVPDMTVAQNLFLGHEPLRGPFIARRERDSRAAEAIARVGGSFAPSDVVSSLSVSDQQLTAIAKALTTDARVVIMDEPSATLTDHDLAEVFRVIRELTAAGKSVIYISHRLDEVKEIGDRATVMRDGATVGVFDIATVTKDELVEAMIGRSVQAHPPRPSHPASARAELLDVRRAAIAGVIDVSGITVRRGEIVGLAGLGGAGRSTLLATLFGDRPATLDLTLNGSRITQLTPRGAVLAGIGLVPEDRKSQGLFLEQSILRNAGIAALAPFGLNPMKAARELCAPPLQQLGVKFSSIDQPVGQLSGGNQQKVVLAKWMARGIDLLLLDEPTRGLDIGAKADLFEQVHALAESGVGVLMASSEMSELTENCDLIWVMHEGKNIAAYDPRNTSPADISRCVVTGRNDID